MERIQDRQLILTDFCGKLNVSFDISRTLKQFFEMLISNLFLIRKLPWGQVKHIPLFTTSNKIRVNEKKTKKRPKFKENQNGRSFSQHQRFMQLTLKLCEEIDCFIQRIILLRPTPAFLWCKKDSQCISCLKFNNTIDTFLKNIYFVLISSSLTRISGRSISNSCVTLESLCRWKVMDGTVSISALKGRILQPVATTSICCKSMQGKYGFILMYLDSNYKSLMHFRKQSWTTPALEKYFCPWEKLSYFYFWYIHLKKKIFKILILL